MDQLKQKWQSNTAVKVYTIRMGDVEDPDLFVAMHLCDWENSEVGKFIMEKSNPTPKWQRYADHTTFGWNYDIIAYLSEQDHIYYKLKYE
jgi:hypothetical protein